MKNKIAAVLITVCLLAILAPVATKAETYAFQLEREDVHVYWNSDGTTSIDYVMVFVNEPYASPMTYVDLGLPNSNFELSSIYADVNGEPVTDISASGYQGDGNSGVAIGLGSLAIPPGERGVVHVFIGTLRRVVYTDSKDKNYASAVFSPTWFDSSYVNGSTDLSVTFHLPPGVQPEEPRWHSAPNGFPDEPQTGIDQEGRIIYTWNNPNANGYTQYIFGASFPSQYIPAEAIISPSVWELMGINPEDAIAMIFCLGFAGVLIFGIVAAFRSTEKRKLQYLPPRMAIEGHGIKRGLTAIEAAILLEQPLDKILTMTLFAVIKKNAAAVLTREPLKLDIFSPRPADLTPYELDFLDAFEVPNEQQRKRKLQDMIVNLVKSVGEKMRGFSRKESLEYYKSITEKAWAQVEAADTPEVKGQKFDEVMEWTMLDRDYDERTRRVFTGPVYVPTWWHHYDPTYSKPASVPVSAAPVGGGGGGLPHLPGSDFAASVVNGVQNFSSRVVGNIGEFTSAVTNKTNPVPVSTSSSSGSHRSGGGGGCACACACACAGCACACAGGGR